MFDIFLFGNPQEIMMKIKKWWDSQWRDVANKFVARHQHFALIKIQRLKEGIHS